MLRRLMPRVERLCSMALVAGGQDAQSPQKDEGRVEAEHRLFALQNRQRFGDAGRLYAQCVGCFRHRS